MKSTQQGLAEVGFEGRLSNLYKLPLILGVNLNDLDHTIKIQCIEKANRYFGGCKDILEKCLLPGVSSDSREAQDAAERLVNKLKEIAKKHGYSEILKGLQSLSPKDHVGVNSASDSFLQARIDEIEQSLNSTRSGNDTYQAFKKYEEERTSKTVMAGMNPQREQAMLLSKHFVENKQQQLIKSINENVKYFEDVISSLSKSPPIEDEEFKGKYDKCIDCLRYNTHPDCTYFLKVETFLEKLQELAKKNGHDDISTELEELTPGKPGPDFHIPEVSFNKLISKVESLSAAKPGKIL
jgi:hypothetical protein